jgi:hypothetical protein
MKPDRVLVLGASGTVTATELEELQFRVVNRPTTIKEIIDTVRVILTSTSFAGA